MVTWYGYAEGYVYVLSNSLRYNQRVKQYMYIQVCRTGSMNYGPEKGYDKAIKNEEKQIKRLLII